MIRGTTVIRLTIMAAACCLATGGWAQAPQSPGRPNRDKLQKPVYKVAQKLLDPASGTQTEGQQQEHPLVPALQMAYSCMDKIRADVKDYSCTMVKRERIGGTLGENEFLFVKVRQEPFSAYTYFVGPEKLKGQEAIYVKGQNDDNLLAHGVGIKKMVGMVNLKPTSMLAMQGQRYPITEIGVANLTKRLIEVAENDKQFGECDVKFFKGAKINGRPSTCIQVEHPVARRQFRFHRARVFVDEEMNIPVRYEAYDWPAEPGSQPPLLEEYTYLNVKLNNGFTDLDFDHRNPAYNFH